MSIPIFDRDLEEEGWVHDFGAHCPLLHKRNFVYDHPSSQKLGEVKARCVYCGKEQTFYVDRYFQEPCLESDWKGVK